MGDQLNGGPVEWGNQLKERGQLTGGPVEWGPVEWGTS